MLKSPLTRTELRRVEAINAAAIAFSSGDYDSIEELWALAVFFERYLEGGAKGTIKEFGPKKTATAKVLKLVPRV
jgi:hypothetical protein